MTMTVSQEDLVAAASLVTCSWNSLEHTLHKRTGSAIQTVTQREPKLEGKQMVTHVEADHDSQDWPVWQCQIG